jgi:hypothetical protein
MTNNYPIPPPLPLNKPYFMSTDEDELKNNLGGNIDMITDTIAQHPKFKVAVKELSESMKEKRAILESKLKEIKSPEIIEKMRKFVKIKESIERQNETERQNQVDKQRELERQKELERQYSLNIREGEVKVNETKPNCEIPVVNMIKIIFDIFDTLSNKSTTDKGTKEEENEIVSLKAEITDLRNEVLDLRCQLSNIQYKKSGRKPNKKHSKHRSDKHHTSKYHINKTPSTSTNLNKQHKGKHYVGKHVLDIIST